MEAAEPSPSERVTGSSNTQNDAFWTQTGEEVTDVELLKRAWRNEKAAPEILAYEFHLVQRSREQIELVEETIAAFAASGADDLMLSLYRMDLDRTLFLLRSYLRIRLQKVRHGSNVRSTWIDFIVNYFWDLMTVLLRSAKLYVLQIEKHVLHILKTEELWNRLSEQEQKFAQR